MDYAAIQQTAATAIQDSGMLFTVTRKTGGIVDGAAGQRVGGAEETWSFYALQGSMGLSIQFAKISAKAATLIAAGALLLLAEVVPGYVPVKGDLLRSVDGNQWIIELADSLAPGGEVIFYRIVARK